MPVATAPMPKSAAFSPGSATETNMKGVLAAVRAGATTKRGRWLVGEPMRGSASTMAASVATDAAKGSTA